MPGEYYQSAFVVADVFRPKYALVPNEITAERVGDVEFVCHEVLASD